LLYKATAKAPASNAVVTPAHNARPSTANIPAAPPFDGPPDSVLLPPVGLGLAGGKLEAVGVPVVFCTVIQFPANGLVRLASFANWLTLKGTLLMDRLAYCCGRVKLRGCSMSTNVYACGMSPTGGEGCR